MERCASIARRLTGGVIGALETRLCFPPICGAGLNQHEPLWQDANSICGVLSLILIGHPQRCLATFFRLCVVQLRAV